MDVLIVEDDPTIAGLLQDALEKAGYVVTGIARTVGEAIAAVAGHQPDYAVIDLHLAHGDVGTEVGAYLRRTTNVGIIYSTGNDGGAITGLLGDAVMTKPYRMADVGRGLSIIREIIQFGKTELAFPHNFRLLAPIPG